MAPRPLKSFLDSAMSVSFLLVALLGCEETESVRLARLDDRDIDSIISSYYYYDPMSVVLAELIIGFRIARG